ncbi:MAG: hypothetical protein RIS94_1829 [Pseudomonadota bacterium]|jgi:8-oxo-dGTP pyrophosphatase MutT (NUDIX family)
MFHLLPPALHRWLLRRAHRVRLRTWALLRLEVRGTNVLVLDPQGRLLMVRHSYHHSDRWMLPGGGLARGEDPVQTGAREVLEETRCRLAEGVWFGTFRRAFPSGWSNRIELITGRTHDLPGADGREIEEARFFPLDALPAETDGAVLQYIEVWRGWTDQSGNSA